MLFIIIFIFLGGYPSLEAAEKFLAENQYEQVSLTLSPTQLEDHGCSAWNRISRKESSEYNAYDVVIHKHRGGSKAKKSYTILQIFNVCSVAKKNVCVLSIGRHAKHTFQVMVKDLESSLRPIIDQNPYLIDFMQLKNDMSRVYQIDVEKFPSLNRDIQFANDMIAKMSTNKNDNNNNNRILRSADQSKKQQQKEQHQKEQHQKKQKEEKEQKTKRGGTSKRERGAKKKDKSKKDKSKKESKDAREAELKLQITNLKLQLQLQQKDGIECPKSSNPHAREAELENNQLKRKSESKEVEFENPTKRKISNYHSNDLLQFMEAERYHEEKQKLIANLSYNELLHELI